MKILKLRFKNLNSLYGEWTIDFTSPAYTADRIFAITGPTGAGKSTLLDAVCLALYGRTPRLKSITKNSNEIMSRQTGECYAEVTFETQAGTFRSHWSQRRAYQKPDGQLGDAKHEMSDAVSGQVLESKKREVAARIETTTGMDFDRFTRSMLLAQGGFSAFLSAAPDHRAPILEQITGTRIYSDISKQVHERHRTEHQALERLQAQTEGIDLLSDEDEQRLLHDIVRNQAIEKTLGTKNEALKRSILWLKGIADLKAELAGIQEESDTLTRQLKAFEVDRAALTRAVKATELDSDHATLVGLRQQQALDLKILEGSMANLPELARTLKLKETRLETSQADLARVKQEQKKERSLIKTVTALDLVIAEKRSALETTRSDCRKIKDQMAGERFARTRARQNRERAEKNLFLVQAFLADHACDAALVTELTGISEQIHTLNTAQTLVNDISKQVTQQQQHLKTRTDNHQAQADTCQTLNQAHEAAKNRVVQTQADLATLLAGRTLREYRAEHEGLLRELAYLKKIESLEHARKKLEDGRACPLCGALHHPFARGNVPEMDRTEKKINVLARLVHDAEHLEKKLKKNQAREKTVAEKRADAEKHQVQLKHQKMESQSTLVRLEQEKKDAENLCIQLRTRVQKSLDPFDIQQLPPCFDNITTTLENRRQQWQDAQQQHTAGQEKIQALDAAISRLDAVLKTLDAASTQKLAVLASQQAELNQLTADRHTHYGQKDPDTEEARLETLVARARTAEKTAGASRDDTQQQLDELRTRVAAVKETMAARTPELDALETRFRAQCKEKGFKDESALCQSRLAIEDRNRLHQQARTLDDRQADIIARKKDRETKLFHEINKNMTQASSESLNAELDQSREALKQAREKIGAIKQTLQDHTAAREKLKEKQSAMAAQKKNCDQWDALHRLIGSADGKKYRNFAQGLTFEVMVWHANQQLEKMTDRYLLIRDDRQPLELNIMDNYQAGEIRSTKNLSGGESFIVSLSLALGLSHMASQNVRVDSLFLDEGFGTLDDDALETALEALSGLQQKGKLIGVISHVSALKERIGTQITILPVSGGKSCISGPGCTGH